MPPKVILWDVMDTLVRDPFRDAMPRFFGLSMPELIAVKHPNAWPRFETNELDEATFLASFFADGRAFDTEGFKACIKAAYRFIDGMEPLLARLSRAGVSMHALSNYPVWYQWIEERLGLSRYLSWRFVSCQTGLRKPALAAYQHALAELGCEPASAVFVDDREVNCEAARKVGLRALRFDGDVARLAAELGAPAA